MSLTTGSVVLEKDKTNLIGISIGGGAPYCPCLYVVQVHIHKSVANNNLDYSLTCNVIIIG